MDILTLDKAKKGLEASEKKAKELGVKVTTAIVDEHGTLLALSRMDGAFFISPRFATHKAYTSASLGLPSGKIAQYAGEGKPYFGINTAFHGDIMVIDGGLPIIVDNKTIGAVGVGGSLDTKQDEVCAEAAVKAIVGS